MPALGAVLAAGHEVVGVYTQPPRAAGRGLAARKSPVQLFAESRGLAVHTPVSLKSAEEQARFKSLNADAGVVVAYGQILPKAILEAPRYGCFNIHASLLPRWRGAAPIQRALLAGDAETGVAVMRIEETLDTGAVCLMERTAIGPDETAGELHDRLSELGAELMVRVLSDLGKGSLACWPQHDEGVTLCRQDRAGRDAHRLVSPGRRGAQSDQGPLAPSRRLDRGRSQRQARARQSPALDPRGGRRQASHRARRSAHHRLRQRLSAPVAGAAGGEAADAGCGVSARGEAASWKSSPLGAAAPAGRCAR